MKKTFLSAALILIIAMLVIRPAKYIDVALDGILVWATCVLPSIFPFMFFTKIFSMFGNIELMTKPFGKITKKLYNVPSVSSYVFFISILSGYPVGAKVTSDLYKEKRINRGQAHRITALTSNSGPMFIVGTVGVGLLISPVAGYIMLFCHIFSSFINGLIYRNYMLSDNEMFQGEALAETKKTRDPVSDALMQSISSILIVGGYICIFFIVTEIIGDLNIINAISGSVSYLTGINHSAIEGIIKGLFEITNGCISVADAEISLAAKAIVSNFIVTLGGLAVSLQALSFLSDFKIKKGFFFTQKITQALISTAISVPFCILLL